jgi:hypothetical protein
MGVILILIAVVLLVFLVPSIFQWLWNITMPQVFGLRPVTYWIAFRLLIIADILFSPATSGFTESRRIKCSNVRRTPRGAGVRANHRTRQFSSCMPRRRAGQ